MFGGGGFTGQMHETNKKNREQLKHVGHEPFKNKNIPASETSNGLLFKEVSETERQAYLDQLKVDRKKTRLRNAVISLISISVTLVILYFLVPRIMKNIVDFVR